MIHLEVCSLIFGQTKLHTSVEMGEGCETLLQGFCILLILGKNLEDINLSNNATNFTTDQLPTLKKMQILLQSTPNSWVPFQRFKISQHSTISTFARLPSRSTYQDIIFKWDRERRDSTCLVWQIQLQQFNELFGWFSTFWRKKLSPPWLSRWRVRRVLIHMRRAKNGTETDLVTRYGNVTKLHVDETRVRYNLEIPSSNPSTDRRRNVLVGKERYEIIF